MPHQDLIIEGQRIPSVTEWLDVMDKKWLRPWYAKMELMRCIEELAEIHVAEKDSYKEMKNGMSAGVRELLAAWRKRVKEKAWAADAKKDAAASIGTDFHNGVEALLSGKESFIPQCPETPALITEFERFHKEWQFKNGQQEIHVVSKRYVFQGTFDYLGEDCKILGLGLWDWKTSNKIDDTFGLQIALYAYAYGEQQGWTEEETWAKITHGGTVRLDKRTGYLEHKIYRDLPYLFRVAAALREPYDYRNQVGAWEAQDD